MVRRETRIENVVASARLDQRIDLRAAAASFPEKTRMPGTFPGLVFRMENPKSSLLIFENGNIICAGTRSEHEARRAIMRCVGELRSAGLISSGDPEVKIRNIVAYVSLKGVLIDIESLAAASGRLGIEAIYEPEQFPGAICRMRKPKVAFLAFSSGKLICAGARSEDDVYRAVERFVEILGGNGLLRTASSLS